MCCPPALSCFGLALVTGTQELCAGERGWGLSRYRCDPQEGTGSHCAKAKPSCELKGLGGTWPLKEEWAYYAPKGWWEDPVRAQVTCVLLFFLCLLKLAFCVRGTEFDGCRKRFFSEGGLNHWMLRKYFSSVKWEISCSPCISLNSVSFIFHCADDYICEGVSLFNDQSGNLIH